MPTNGRIANGANGERELKFKMASLTNVRISLRNPDLTTARRTARVINRFLRKQVAVPTDPSTIAVKVPDGYPGGVVAMLTDIEQLLVAPDQVARVVIDERSGVTVMGENVRISAIAIAIAQGNLTIRVTESAQVSQPNAFSSAGSTATVDRTKIEVTASSRRLAMLPAGVSVQELVNGLNAMGVSPRDLITILQTIKASGSLQAEIEVL